MEYGCVRVGGGGIAEIPELVAAEEGRFHFGCLLFERHDRSIDRSMMSRERDNRVNTRAAISLSARLENSRFLKLSRASREVRVYKVGFLLLFFFLFLQKVSNNNNKSCLLLRSHQSSSSSL